MNLANSRQGTGRSTTGGLPQLPSIIASLRSCANARHTIPAIPGALLLAVLALRSQTPHRVLHRLPHTVPSCFRTVPDVVFVRAFVTNVALDTSSGCSRWFAMTPGPGKAPGRVDGRNRSGSTAGVGRCRGIWPAADDPRGMADGVAGQLLGLLRYHFDVNARSSPRGWAGRHRRHRVDVQPVRQDHSRLMRY